MVGELFVTYCLPAVLLTAAIVPGVNFVYSGHGGFAWLLLPLGTPFVLVRALLKCTRGPEPTRAWFRRFFKLSVPVYAALLMPLSWAAATSINSTFGLEVTPLQFFSVAAAPFPWWYFR